MSAVIEVGPRTVRSPGTVPPEWISVGIDCIDDRTAVLEGHLVETSRLWRDLLEAALGEPARTVVLVFPTWWSWARVELVADAAQGLAADVVVVNRVSVLGADCDATVVELAEELVVIAAPGADPRVLPRATCDVADHLEQGTDVLVDVPAEVSPLTARHLDAASWGFSDRQHLLRSVNEFLGRRGRPEPPAAAARSRRRLAAVLGGVLASSVVAGGHWLARTPPAQPLPDSSTKLLVEGRAAVLVPSAWTVERITSGPGSARVRVSAPGGGPTALHITQSAGTTAATITEVAETLRRALQSERPGVFVDFSATADVGGRPAVTYRELRADSETSWAVVIDGATRIAIGCQSPPGGSDAIGEACERAVRSARVPR